MEQFDWKAHLSDTFHSSFTLSGRRPVIGITGNYGEQTCKLAETYYKQVVKAGGTPLIISCQHPQQHRRFDSQWRKRL